MSASARIQTEIRTSLCRTGKVPSEIVLTSEEMADLKNELTTLQLLMRDPVAVRIVQVCGVPIREQAR